MRAKGRAKKDLYVTSHVVATQMAPTKPNETAFSLGDNIALGNQKI